MRYVRSLSFWLALLILLPVILVASLCLGVGSLIWAPYFISRSLYLGLTALAMGLLFTCFPFYMLYSLYGKSVRYVDVDSTTRVTYMGGKQADLGKAKDSYIRTGSRGMQDLIIVGDDGQHSVNMPYLFKDREGLFAALEAQSGRPIRKG